MLFIGTGVDVRKVVHRAIGIVACLIGIGLIWYGAKLTVPDVLTNADYHELSARVRTPAEPPSDDGPVVVDENVETDWRAVLAEMPQAVGWLTVGNTIIDYPVVQGTDNEYFLNYDAYGRESSSCAFLDYRANPDGIADVIYCHTHALRMGFHDLGQADEQWSFDEIGTVLWSTPGKGTTAYRPVCALHVFPDYQDIQRFEFDEDSAVYSDAVKRILSNHAARGEWNMTTIKGIAMLSDKMELVEPAAGGHEHVNYWWSLTADEDAAAHAEAQRASWRLWMHSLLGQASARSADAEAIIDSGTRTMTLGCCSWPLDDHRTLLVCVA
jgi:hypothetical protein